MQVVIEGLHSCFMQNIEALLFAGANFYATDPVTCSHSYFCRKLNHCSFSLLALATAQCMPLPPPLPLFMLLPTPCSVRMNY